MLFIAYNFIEFEGPPIDECALGLHDCDPAAVCNDTRYYFTCTCMPNWIKQGLGRVGQCLGKWNHSRNEVAHVS